MDARYWQRFYEIQSKQRTVHESLQSSVMKRRQTEFQSPISSQQQRLYVEVMHEIKQPVILDCGCGTGMSTAILAERNPDCVVIGIDQSFARLSRHPAVTLHKENPVVRDRNKILVQADLVSWWLMASSERQRIKKAYFLYPNPWPKPKHFKRRWQGHPIWPLICELADEIEMRTNWLIYAQEWQAALAMCARDSQLRDYDGEPETRFETKYQQVGVDCYQVVTSQS